MLGQLDILDTKCADLVAEAIADDRVGLDVQGIHAASNTDQILYGECSAHLTGSDGCMYGASDFVPLLEILGETPMLDRHVLALVLDMLEADPHAVLGCNLSAHNLVDAATWNVILRQVAARAQLANRLVLELTETRALKDLTLSAMMLADIRRLGCRVALDDFGTGFASPEVLRLTPVDIVKIDASFLWDIHRSPNGGDSLSHMVGLAGCFAPIVVIEGVESEDEANCARGAGATHLQGYHLSQPVKGCKAKHVASEGVVS
ncbi:EAL domain-containing protein [Agrobacterium sp. LMR679]|uniref:EAL domain-containing protein n=1 Tax=Agrobacterium sp. LMR679 TaxID=3014335 RepID=UPI0022AEECC6|nr:EAL domain-containing protein [Agrobacterium sp. LMR679]MCZ4072112.1 EAL domain-containing protein [Agrobacterium sp. LMR679]